MCPWFKSWSRHQKYQALSEKLLSAFLFGATPVLPLKKIVAATKTKNPRPAEVNQGVFLSVEEWGLVAGFPFPATMPAKVGAAFPWLRAGPPTSADDIIAHLAGVLFPPRRHILIVAGADKYLDSLRWFVVDSPLLQLFQSALKIH